MIIETVEGVVQSVNSRRGLVLVKLDDGSVQEIHASAFRSGPPIRGPREGERVLVLKDMEERGHPVVGMRPVS